MRKGAGEREMMSGRNVTYRACFGGACVPPFMASVSVFVFGRDFYEPPAQASCSGRADAPDRAQSARVDFRMGRSLGVHRPRARFAVGGTYALILNRFLPPVAVSPLVARELFLFFFCAATARWTFASAPAAGLASAGRPRARSRRIAVRGYPVLLHLHPTLMRITTFL